MLSEWGQRKDRLSTNEWLWVWNRGLFRWGTGSRVRKQAQVSCTSGQSRCCAESAPSGSPPALRMQSPAASHCCHPPPLVLPTCPRDAAAPGAPMPLRVLQPSASAEVCSAWACGDHRGSHPAGWSLWGCWACAAASSRVMSCGGVETHSDISDSSRSQSTETGEGIKMGAQQ